MNIALIDPFYDTSHRAWAEGLIEHSSHHFTLITQPPFYWKWRMMSSGIDAAAVINDRETPFDLLLATDMLNVTQMKSLLSPTHRDTPIALYMHENQITYDAHTEHAEPDHTYGWINYTSCLCADAIYFNSAYHRSSFIDALPSFLRMFPKNNHLQSVESISAKSSVLSLGMSLL